MNNFTPLEGFTDLELSTQILIKEAMGRGIDVEILDRKENFLRLNKGARVEYVKQATKTSLDTYIAPLTMENKHVTKMILSEAGLNVPEGSYVLSFEEGIKLYEKYNDFKIVVKPKNTNFGKGITIIDKNFSFNSYKTALNLAFSYDDSVLIEKFVEGKEYRFFVIDDEGVGILHRVPANVTGDGVNTIEELVAIKNHNPLRGIKHVRPLEKINLGDIEKDFLKNQGLTVKNIPEKNQTVFLRENSNISTGGDSIDYTDEMHESYKKIAVASVKAAGAVISGVDMIVRDLSVPADEKNYSIIEINFNPAIHIHCYPLVGKNRHPERKLLDLLFPESVS